MWRVGIIHRVWRSGENDACDRLPRLRVSEGRAKRTFGLEVDVLEERCAGHQLGVDFQFTTSPRDQMAILLK